MKVQEQFNPMSDLFVAQFAKPTQFEEINLRALTPFQRALLVIDGTVTKFIETYTLEPIEIVRLGQHTQALSADHVWLEAPQGTEVVARQVILRGKYSYILYAYAVSLIVPARLPDQIRQGLEVEGGALGRILLSGQMETRREVLWYGRERLHPLPEPIQHLTDGEFLSRTYRIIAGGQPLMLINEKFPMDLDRPTFD
ncbi:MAG: DUF98 domain-containing protein [Nitrospinota bacterium]|nr:MAG: DUF98 domain-containing protein [Nitrospinota bacterium]